MVNFRRYYVDGEVVRVAISQDGYEWSEVKEVAW